VGGDGGGGGGPRGAGRRGLQGSGGSGEFLRVGSHGWHRMGSQTLRL
jgi:hypothetical protein